MSSKKLPPMDTIITRRKSAQLKRQLRNQDASRQKISQITQLLRSPKSQVKSLKKKGKKDASKEFYPDKARRRVEAKKVVLKPKHQMKVVAMGSKRKGVPQKGSNVNSPTNKRQKPDQSVTSETQPRKLMDRIQNELSIDELVRQMDCEMLNDEDLLEILTCESPVWWEDPPDEGYCEDPIFTRKSSKSNLDNDSDKTSSKSSETKEQTSPEITEKLKIPQRKETDEKFMKKRSKLENLLGSIKTKLTPKKSDNLCTKDNKIETNKLKTDENNTKSIKNDIKPIETNENFNKVSQKIKRVSESTEGDDPFSNLRDDDILRDLENIDIPVEPVKPDSSNTDDCVIITNTKEVDQKIKSKMKIRNEYLNILRKKNVINDINDKSNKTKQELHDKSSFSVTSIEKDTLSSPISRSFSDDTLDTISLVSHDIDSISDTNIKFIDDDSTSLKSNKDTDKTDDVTFNVVNNKNLLLEDLASKSNIIQTQSNIKSNVHNCLTVYKIITKDEIDLNVIKKEDILKNNALSKTEMNEKSDNLDGKLNSFYKKCKNTYQRKICTKKTEETNQLKEINVIADKSSTNSKPIIITNNSSVKYCFKCSSIFDTETCAYCISKTKISDENNHEDKPACSCNNEIESEHNVDKNSEEQAKK